MAKYIIYSDLHLRPDRIDDAMVALSQIRQAAIEHKATVINGGDTFHTRGILRTNCLDILIKEWKCWNDLGIKQIILVGNHDQEDKAGDIHPFEFARLFDGWEVVDTPRVINRIAFFPYLNVRPTKKFVEAVSGSARYAVVHWGFMGAMMNDSYRSTEGVSMDTVEGFKRVWAGHFHLRESVGNIQYIGSPYQQTFAEMKQDKGFWIWDSARDKAEYVPIVGTRKHYEVEIAYEGKKKTVKKSGEFGPRDFVRVNVKGERAILNALDRRDIKKITGAEEFKLTKDIIDTDFSRLKIDKDSIDNTRDIMNKYVDFVDTDLDRDRLLEVASELLR